MQLLTTLIGRHVALDRGAQNPLLPEARSNQSDAHFVPKSKGKIRKD
jgi:hypothetical protein